MRMESNYYQNAILTLENLVDFICLAPLRSLKDVLLSREKFHVREKSPEKRSANQRIENNCRSTGKPYQCCFELSDAKNLQQVFLIMREGSAKPPKNNERIHGLSR